MSEKRKVLLDLAGKKEIKYSVTKIKRAKNEEIDEIWDRLQEERLGETNEFISNMFIDKMCEILQSTNIIESSEDTSFRLKARKAFIGDMKNIASYFSALIPYIGLLEGGIVLGKDVYDHKTSINKNEASFSSEERNEQDYTSTTHENDEECQDNKCDDTMDVDEF